MTTPKNNYTKLSLMMFLQFFVWGSWFATLGSVLTNAEMSGIIGDAYGAGPISAIIAPLFLGLIADRFFPSQKVMGVLFLLGAGTMLAIPGSVESGNASMVRWLIMAHLLCYMPTLGLGNTIAFSNVERDLFPKVRVWGTIGWIVAGLVGGFLAWSASTNLFWMAGISSAVLGLFCFTLPNTPPPAMGEPLKIRSLLMVDAFKMLGNPGFLVFIICSTLICVPLAYYYAFTAPFIGSAGFSQPASAMTIGQMSEIVFMLLIPFFFRKLGVKVMILIGMATWVGRYLLFAYGAPDQVAWMLFAGIAVHGICYDFFFVTGFMYTDQKAPKAIRGQAQSMLVFFTQGIGMFFGYQYAGSQFGKVAEANDTLATDIASHGAAQELSFAQQFGQMFQVKLPEQLNSDILNSAMMEWKAFWQVPAIMAAVILVVFALTFWDKTNNNTDND